MAPDVRQYTDLRDFLIDFFNYKKSNNSQWSFRSWAFNLGLKSHANFVSFLGGKRNLTKTMQERLGLYFKFDPISKEYFDQLCSWERFSFDNPELSKRLRGVVIENEGQSDQFEIVCAKESFSPLITLVGELLRKSKRALNVKEIHSLMIPTVTVDNVTSALERLLDLGLITQTEQGYVHLHSNKDVTMSKDNLNLKNSFALSLAANNSKPQELASNFFVKQVHFRLSDKNFAEFERRMTEAIKSIVMELWSSEDDVIYDFVASMQPMVRPLSELDERRGSDLPLQ